MRCRLRTLLILLAVLPPVLALGWWGRPATVDVVIGGGGLLGVVILAVTVPLIFVTVANRTIAAIERLTGGRRMPPRDRPS